MDEGDASPDGDTPWMSDAFSSSEDEESEYRPTSYGPSSSSTRDRPETAYTHQFKYMRQRDHFHKTVLDAEVDVDLDAEDVCLLATARACQAAIEDTPLHLEPVVTQQTSVPAEHSTVPAKSHGPPRRKYVTDSHRAAHLDLKTDMAAQTATQRALPVYEFMALYRTKEEGLLALSLSHHGAKAPRVCYRNRSDTGKPLSMVCGHTVEEGGFFKHSDRQGSSANVSDKVAWPSDDFFASWVWTQNENDCSQKRCPFMTTLQNMSFANVSLTTCPSSILAHSSMHQYVLGA